MLRKWKSADESYKNGEAVKNHSYEDRLKVLNLTTFKYRRLDKFWYNQDLKFDWKAEISGIGSRRLKFS